MTLQGHRSLADYWADVAPRLEKFVNSQRNQRVEAALVHGLALYSWCLENFQASATQAKDVLSKTATMLIQLQDVIRALPAVQAELSPVAAVALQRVSLEIRCNFTFILKSSDPKLYADRFARFAEIERILHDEYRPSGEPPMLTRQEDAAIRAKCPEWFVKPNGSTSAKVVVKHWTAEANFASVRKVAQAAGLEDEYHRLYSGASLFVHGSSRVVNTYRDPKRGLGALAGPKMCSQMTLFAAMNCMKTLESTVAFFGVPSIDKEIAEWNLAWLSAAKGL